MDELLQKTAACLSAYRGKKIAVGVSGGRDSMCLLHAVLACGVADKTDVTAVHVNHGIRENAVRDENFVRARCGEMGVKFICERVDAVGESRARGLTLEQAARNLRYGAFYEAVKRGAADIVLTAHHALDNAESVLMHLFRGSGLDGARGMTEPAQGIECGGSRPIVVRPFIDVYPQEIEEYCGKNGIEFVTDETNLIDDADRNFLRLNVIPLIEQRYRGAVKAINAFSRECATACSVLDGLIDMRLIEKRDGAVIVYDEALRGDLAARYIRRALEEFTLVDVTRTQIERVAALVDMRTGAAAELANGVIAAREYGSVALYLPRLPYDGERPLVTGANYIDGLKVTVEQSDESPTSVKGGAVDLAALDGAVLRFRRDGDVFTPYGGKRKKLKQYFIDRKIPKRVRDRSPLICRGNEVLVIVGVEISDGVKQTESTTVRAVVRKTP